MQKCDARYYQGQWLCQTCGLTWDYNDPERPQCQPLPKPIQPQSKRISLEQLRSVREAIQSGDWSKFD